MRHEKLGFNFNPTTEQLEDYFNSYDYMNIKESQDDIVDTIIKLFNADEWKWVSVESSGETIAIIPMPCDDGYGFSFKISKFKEENAAAFILFMVLSLIHSVDGESSEYEQNFIYNLDQKSCLILETGFDFVNQTLGVDLGKLFGKIVGCD